MKIEVHFNSQHPCDRSVSYFDVQSIPRVGESVKGADGRCYGVQSVMHYLIPQGDLVALVRVA